MSASTTHHGDSLSNASYYAEGNDALAVADGRVTEKDIIPVRFVPMTGEVEGEKTPQ